MYKLSGYYSARNTFSYVFRTREEARESIRELKKTMKEGWLDKSKVERNPNGSGWLATFTEEYSNELKMAT